MKKLFALTVIFALVLAGCGDESNDGGDFNGAGHSISTGDANQQYKVRAVRDFSK